MHPETRFRTSTVLPFLKTLRHTVVFPIQQKAIRGTPDLLLCCSGKFVALELKSEHGCLSALQKYNLEQVRKVGGVAIVASPLNWREVSYMLAKLDEGETIV